MMKFRILICESIVIVTFLIGASAGVAQKGPLPDGLTEKSSLKEIVNWLTITSIPKSRIGLDYNALETTDTTDATRYSEWTVFSKGFKLAAIDGCKMTLQNDNLKLISFSTKYLDPTKGSLPNYRKISNDQTMYSGDLIILLDRLSDKTRKPLFQYTKKSDKAILLGTWRTKFRLKGGKFSPWPIPSKEEIKTALANPPLSIKIKGSREDGRDESMTGDTITFSFDSKDEAERFNSVFRLAIGKCAGK